MVHVRFAPSPTGNLHIGNARAAVINTLFALKNGGRLTLRMDDTDRARSQKVFEDQIIADLAWLDIKPTAMVHQSSRQSAYAKAIATLKASGRLYPCYETPEELEFKRKQQLSRGLPPRYDRAALALTADARAALEAQGIAPHWRFKMLHEPILWSDAIRGDVAFHGAHISDPVLVRQDGEPIYILASVVDDIDLGITHIIRGEDHVTNTAVQVQIFEALGQASSAITFGHFSLITDRSGQGFSKRDGSLSLKTLREHGYDPMTIVSLIAKLGTSDAIVPSLNWDELAQDFDLQHFSRATPKFDPTDLDALNHQLIARMDWPTAQTKLAALGIQDAHLTEGVWTTLAPNLTFLHDLQLWLTTCFGTLTTRSDDPELIHAARACLPEDPWDSETWTAWTQTLHMHTGKRGRKLYMPLRQALTGMDHGPEMKHLLPLIGRERALERLACAHQHHHPNSVIGA